MASNITAAVASKQSLPTAEDPSPVVSVDRSSNKNGTKVHFDPGQQQSQPDIGSRTTPEIREPSEKSTPVSPMDNAFFPGPEKWWYQKECEGKGFSLNLEPENWWGSRRHSETDIIGIPPAVDRRRSLTPDLSCSKAVHDSKEDESANKDCTARDVKDSSRCGDKEKITVASERACSDESKPRELEIKQEKSISERVKEKDCDPPHCEEMMPSSATQSGCSDSKSSASDSKQETDSKKEGDCEDSVDALQTEKSVCDTQTDCQQKELQATSSGSEMKQLVSGSSSLPEEGPETQLSKINEPQAFAHNGDDLRNTEQPLISQQNSASSSTNGAASGEQEDAQRPEDAADVSSNSSTVEGGLSEPAIVVERQETQSGNNQDQLPPPPPPIVIEPKQEANNNRKSDFKHSQNLPQPDVNNSEEQELMSQKEVAAKTSKIPEVTPTAEEAEQVREPDVEYEKTRDKMETRAASHRQDLQRPLNLEQDKKSPKPAALASTQASTTDSSEKYPPQEERLAEVSKLPETEKIPPESLVHERSSDIVCDSKHSKRHLEQTVASSSMKVQQSAPPSEPMKISHRVGKKQLEEVPVVRKDEEQTGGAQSKWNSFTIFITIGVILLLLSYLALENLLSVTLTHFRVEQQPHLDAVPASKYSREISFKEHLKRLEEDFPSQSPILWNVVGGAVFSHIQDPPLLERPVVLLLAGLPKSESTTVCLATKLGAMFYDIFQSSRQPTVVNGTLFHNLKVDDAKMKIDESLRAGFQNNAHCAIVHNVDAIPPCSILLFHSYCENDNAPFKDVAIIHTLQLKHGDMLGELQRAKDYERVVSNYLRRVWQPCSELPEDKQDAMLSRIANNVAVIKEEPDSQLSRVCS